MLLALLLAATMQTTANVKNPRNIEFTCPDHARDDEHGVNIYKSDGTLVQTIVIGDPVAGADGIVRATLNVQPIAFGTGFYVTVHAIAAGAFSDESAHSNLFDRVPGSPTNTIVK
jgi:hypothetical protein